MTGELTHVDAQGRARMVDVSEKDATARVAVARGTVTMASTSGESALQNSTMASAPCVPGLPDGMRSSTILRSPNSDMLAPAACSSPQLKLRSTESTSRSMKPSARAFLRMASAASMERSGSSPWMR